MDNFNKSISNNKILKISDILRDLGFNYCHKGTKLISKAIEYVTISNFDFYTVDEVYKYLSKYYNLSYYQVKSSIKYAIITRNITKSKFNFEKVFGYEYDEYVFSPKALIEEITYITK